MSDAVHDLSLTVLTINGQRIPSSGDGDFIVFDEEVLYEAPETLGDGQTVLNRRQSKRRMSTVTVGQYSEGYRALHALLLAQEGINGAAGRVGFPAAWLDPQNGEQIVSPRCVIMAIPSQGAARASGTRAFSLAWLDSNKGLAPLTIPPGGGALP